MPEDTQPSPAVPHSCSLRLWREDLAHCTYFITCCTDSREPLLSHDGVAEVVCDTLRFADEQSWVMVFGYVIMPDHWHVIWKLGLQKTLASVMQSAKRWSGRRINEALGRSGRVWQDGYYEHLIRDYEDFEGSANYMAMNPVRRGLADRPGEYRWCSVNGLK